MFKLNKSVAHKYERDGLTSYILLQKGDVPNDQLAVTWVDIAPNSAQKPHSHDSEQVYVIVKGNGRMLVGDEEQDVGEGDLIYIPSNLVHSLENQSTQVLTYISASTPAFDLIGLYDTGDLRSRTQ